MDDGRIAGAATARYARKKDGPVMGRGFGHMGGSDAMFLADRILSIEYLGPIAPQLR